MNLRARDQTIPLVSCYPIHYQKISKLNHKRHCSTASIPWVSNNQTYMPLDFLLVYNKMNF